MLSSVSLVQKLLNTVTNSPSTLLYFLTTVFVVGTLLTVDLSELSGSSEAREAHVISSIVNGESWILPTRYGIIPSKPPLFHWTGALLSLSTGISPLAAGRIISILSGGIILFLTGLLIQAILLRDKTTASPSVAILVSTIILGSFYGFTTMCIKSMVDTFFAMLCMGATLSLLFPLLRGAGRFSQKDWVKFYFLCSLAVLAKGPLGLLLPGFLSLVATCWFFGIAAALKTFAVPNLGWLIFCAIAPSWYYLAAQIGNNSFTDRQLIFENVARFFGGERVNTQPWWYYIKALFDECMPWAPLALYLFAIRAKKIWNKEIPKTAGDVGFVLFFAGTVIFSLAAGKRGSYLLPLYPYLVCFVTSELLTLYSRISPLYKERWRSAGKVAGRIFAFLIIGVLLLSVIYLSIAGSTHGVVIEHIKLYVTKHLVLLSVVLGISVFFFLSSSHFKKDGMKAALCFFIGLSLSFPTFIVLTNGVKAQLKGFDRIGAHVKETVPFESTLYVVRPQWNELMDPVLYYLSSSQRHVVCLESEEKLPSTAVVTNDYLLAELSAIASLHNYAHSWYYRVHSEKKRKTELVLLQMPRTN